MNNTDQKIEKMLEAEYSYAEIESALGVSSKTIAKVNKQRKEQESTNERTLEKRFPDNFPEDREETTYSPVIGKQIYPDVKHKFNHMEPRESENYRQENKSEAEIRLEELRLQQDHEFRLKQFEWNKEKEEKEFNLKSQEINQNQQKLDLEQNRTNDKYQEYIFKIKSLADRCAPGIWAYNNLIDLYNDAEKLSKKVEKFCYVHSIKFNNTLNQEILDAICDTLDELIDQNDENEKINWEFDDQFEELMDLAGKL